ncbi:MAG: TIGR02281 family clan AA aspartic protease [Rhodocyclales bacterium]|nr:TIGR02281 family clan AA aspartic protease [Rhodocyclales bacterium]
MALTMLCLSPAVSAADVGVAGIFPGKALLVIDGGTPRLVAVGQKTAEGVRVVAIDGESVTLDVEGKKRTLRMGQSVVSQKSSGDVQEMTLAADSRGHFVTQGAVNGQVVRFLVDTGATMVSLGAADATRIGIDWRKGQPGVAQTANGQARAWKVRLDTVRIGEIVVHGVDGIVHETDLPVALLGMSFLSRMDIRNEGSTMTLRKKY